MSWVPRAPQFRNLFRSSARVPAHLRYNNAATIPSEPYYAVKRNAVLAIAAVNIGALILYTGLLQKMANTQAQVVSVKSASLNETFVLNASANNSITITAFNETLTVPRLQPQDFVGFTPRQVTSEQIILGTLAAGVIFQLFGVIGALRENVFFLTTYIGLSALATGGTLFQAIANSQDTISRSNVAESLWLAGNAVVAYQFLSAVRRWRQEQARQLAFTYTPYAAYASYPVAPVVQPVQVQYVPAAYAQAIQQAANAAACAVPACQQQAQPLPAKC